MLLGTTSPGFAYRSITSSIRLSHQEPQFRNDKDDAIPDPVIGQQTGTSIRSKV
jgi:hypothetical protein